VILGGLALLSTVVPGLRTRPHGGTRRSRERLAFSLWTGRVAVSRRTVRSEPACELLAGPSSGLMLLVGRQVDLHRLLECLVRDRLRGLLHGHEPSVD
jgi:hypothetical protein